MGPAEQTASPDRRAESPAGQGGVEVPEPEREAQVGGDASVGAAILEASPVLPGQGKKVMSTIETSDPSDPHKIECTIRRSSK